MNLLHLRARWYSPSEGVFLSRDAVESEPPYQYVRGNPVNFVDPTGFDTCSNYPGGDCPRSPGQDAANICKNVLATVREECIRNAKDILSGDPIIPDYADRQDDRDLTSWMFRELKAALRNPDIGFIKQLFEDDPGGVFYGKYVAGKYWEALVRDKARYDFKHKIREQMGDTILFMSNENVELWSEYSLPGNIFFGYVGSHIGFYGWLTHVGAGWAEMGDPAHKVRRNICDTFYLPPERIWTLGDDTLDYNSVQFGIDLWNKYGASITEYQLRDELEQNYHKFALPPEWPGQGNTPGYGWQGNVFKKWPYKEGDFIGPRAAEFWPPKAGNNSELNFD